MTIKDVARNLGLHWNTVKDIEKQKIASRYKKIDMSNVKHIAIDEFAIAKGHVYQTVVMDLLEGRIIYVAKDREMSSLDNFWKMVDRDKVKIEAVAMDMWPAYIGSTLIHCPSAAIVFDRFHIVKKLNETIDETRRLLYNEEKDINKKKIIKGTRWLLLKKGFNVSESGQKRLQEALAVNEPLAQVYYLKEELDLLWQETDTKEAGQQVIGQQYRLAWPLRIDTRNTSFILYPGETSWPTRQGHRRPVGGAAPIGRQQSCVHLLRRRG